jgi:hypothetical protein
MAGPSGPERALPGLVEVRPLAITCLYRFQSHRRPEMGALRGSIVQVSTALSADRVNEQLRGDPRWRGRSLVNLKVALVRQRTGAFHTNSDALYYHRNFRDVEGTEIDSDLLDITKLQALFADRLTEIAAIFVPEAYSWLISLIGPVESAATNEYMCHEAGHRLSFAVDEKFESGFFRRGGRLAWPLIYLEEYRADANSWDIAAQTLENFEVARVVLYTLVHRFGLAVQNLRLGRPGAGYVPFLHFAAMVDCGLLKVAEAQGRRALDFVTRDIEAVSRAAAETAAVVDHEINRREHSADNDESAEAMLDYAVARLARDDLTNSFGRLMRS